MNKTWSAWSYLWKSVDIRRMLLMTIGLLVIYRLAANVPTPGIDANALKQIQQQLAASGGNFFSFLDLLSGGTVSRFSLLSMGVYPYITAQIIIQLLVPIIPALQKQMDKDPKETRKLMEKWTIYLTVPMAALSAIGQINIFNSLVPGTTVLDFGITADKILPSMTALLSMIAGTLFAIWLGELISEKGLKGQGLSLIIFAGIVARMPANLANIMADQNNRWIMLFLMIVIIVLTIFAIVYVQGGQRRVVVLYPGRMIGGKMSMAVKTTMPLNVNMAGMIPLIFASAILQFPAILSSYFIRNTNVSVAAFAQGVQSTFSSNSTIYWVLYFFMVVVFTFFYTDVLFSQQNYGEELKKAGAQVPGFTRGEPTQKYLTKVQRRITLPGALFLGLVAILPFVLSLFLKVIGIGSGATSAGLFLVSSSGLLIVVGVVRDIYLSLNSEVKEHTNGVVKLIR